MIPQWFLYLQGFAMVLMGVSLLAMRPRKRGDSLYVRYVNLGTLWALVCGAVGVLLLSMALGYWSWSPAGTTDPSPTRAPARRHGRTSG